MSWFDDVDGIGIIERHIQDVLELEEDQAKRILRRYKEIRQDLRDRLDSVRSNTFTAQQLRGVLAQVEGAISAMTESLKGEMDSAARETATSGINDLISEIRKFDQHFMGAVTPINLNVAILADDTKTFLLNRYQASLDAYGQDLIGQLTQNISNAALMEMPYGQLIQKLGQFFLGEEWKLHRIVRTELHNVYNIGKMNGMEAVQEQYLPDLQKTLIHPMDSRTGEDSKQAARLDLVVDIDEPFRYRWKGEIREFMAPPDRPNDRAILVPYRKSWGAV